jgi:protein-disulfide isomerase
MYCVAADDPANALPFLQALYENQPEEQSTGLDDATLTSIAQGVGAGEGVASCIADGTYSRYVTAKTRETPIQTGASGVSTPTIVVNGQTLTNQTDLTGDPQADIVARFS